MKRISRELLYSGKDSTLKNVRKSKSFFLHHTIPVSKFDAADTLKIFGAVIIFTTHYRLTYLAFCLVR